MTLPVHTHLLLRGEFAMCVRPAKLLNEGDSVVAVVNWSMSFPLCFVKRILVCVLFKICGIVICAPPLTPANCNYLIHLL